jgi:hypothetical protein
VDGIGGGAGRNVFFVSLHCNAGYSHNIMIVVKMSEYMSKFKYVGTSGRTSVTFKMIGAD